MTITTMMRVLTTRRAVVWLGTGLVALTLGALALHIPGTDDLGDGARKQIFVALLATAAVAYLLAVRAVLRGAAVSVALVLVVAVALRIPPLLAPPFLSSDVYRYVWDGRVQDAGINPYRYVPADPALATLRDTAIYPHVNRAGTARTIYPPAAQLVFRAVAALSPTVLAMKLAMVGFEVLACWAMLRLLALARLPRAQVLIYAWNPLAVWAFAGNGHVDAMAIGLLGLALLAAAARRDTWTGIALGAAVLVKFLPAAIAPALWRRAAPWRLPLVTLGVMAVLYLAYVGAGWHVLGFLPGYFGDEDLTQGTGIWLLAGLGLLMPVTPLMARVYAGVAAIALFSLAAWTAFRPRPDDGDPRWLCGDAALLAAAVTVAISPHYPWYFVWLALPCVLCARWSTIWLSVAPVLLYLDPWHERFLWPSLVYLPTAALALYAWWQASPRRTPASFNVTQGSP